MILAKEIDGELWIKASDHHQAIAELERQEPVAWMKPDVLCDRACMYLCTKGFTQFPECATIHPPPRKPLTDEMAKQMKERCDSMEMRGAFADGWLSAEAAHGIKE